MKMTEPAAAQKLRCSPRCAPPRGRSSSSRSFRPKRRAGAVRASPRSGAARRRERCARRRARAACSRRRRGADRRAAVRPLQRRRLRGARRRHRRRQRRGAAAAGAQCRGVVCGHAPALDGRAGHRDRDRHRRRDAARRRRGGDGRADRAHRRRRAPAIELRRAVAPGQFISYAGSDIARGETVLRRGARSARARSACWRPAGSRRSTSCGGRGSRCCRPATSWWRRASRCGPARSMIRNGAIVAAAVTEAGGEPVAFGAFPDDEAALEAADARARSRACDMVVLSGGTSKGAGDLSHRIVSRLGAPGVIVHGVALKPGKPLCLAVVRGQAGRGAAGIPDLGDLHVPRLRRAGDPRPRRAAAGSRAKGRRDSAGAHRVRARPQGVRAGGAGRGRGRPGRVPDRPRAPARSRPFRRPTVSSRSTRCAPRSMRARGRA